MIDIKLLKKDPKKIINLLNKRGEKFNYLKYAVELDNLRIKMIKEFIIWKTNKNIIAEKIGKIKRKGKNIKFILDELNEMKLSRLTGLERGKKIERKLKETKKVIKEILLKTPNVPHETVPIGNDEKSNIEIKKYGKPLKFNFEPKDHTNIATNLNIISFTEAVKISGSRFAIYKGDGAKLHRALSQYLLDKQTEQNGFLEMVVPYIVNKNTMENTGQLPKFEKDLYKITNDMYLIPTAEVPLTNIHKNNIINVENTIKYCSYTPCFRSEAGSAGKDVKGIIRQHQFHKVEMVMFSKPENSMQDLEIMTTYVEEVLQELELPYRILELCIGDLGFASSKTFDIEVWLPSQKVYKEISSCSNMSDFQARRANIRYRTKNGSLAFVHTLNGSNLPIGRTLAAILENYQQKDGSVKIPKVLIPYLNKEIIK